MAMTNQSLTASTSLAGLRQLQAALSSGSL